MVNEYFWNERTSHWEERNVEEKTLKTNPKSKTFYSKKSIPKKTSTKFKSLFRKVIPLKTKTKTKVKQKLTSEQLRNLRLRKIQQQQMNNQIRARSNLSRQDMLEEYNQRRQTHLALQQQQNQTQSPSFKELRDNLLRVQNLGKIAEMKRRRILAEREGISSMANMFKAHENLNKIRLDATGVKADNILLAENVFKESLNNPNILKSNRPNILQTRETGNSLFF